MLKKQLLVGAGVLAASVALASPANAATVATFQDPTIGVSGTPPPYLFTYTANAAPGVVGSTLTGGYDSAGANPDLTLQIGSTTYLAAGFTFPTLTVTAGDTTSLTLSGGTIEFFDSSHNAVLFIDFNNAQMSGNDVGADDLSGQIVNIRPPSGPDIYLDPEQFAFSFANKTQSLVQAEANASAGTGSDQVQATAAFTSSATVVPEPGSMMLLGTGLFGLARVARRRFNLGAR